MTSLRYALEPAEVVTKFGSVGAKVLGIHSELRAVFLSSLHCTSVIAPGVLDGESLPFGVWHLNGLARGEQQDKQITHDSPPFVNDKGSIYFLPEKGVTNASEQFGGARK